MPSQTRDLGTDLGLLALAAIWGINFTVVKIVLGELDPLALNALRFPLASAAMVLLVRAVPGPRWPERRDWGRVVLLAVLGNVVYQVCFIVGLDWTFAGNASLLLATVPVWTVILSAAYGHERPGPWVWFGVSATFVGMILVILGGSTELALGGETLRGDLLMVVAAATSAMYPTSANWRRVSIISFSSPGSSPEVGSSKKNIQGSANNSAAMLTRFCWP